MERRIEVSTVLSARWGEARRVLIENARSVLSDEGIDGEHEDGPVRTGLEVDLGAGASVHQDVWLQLGDGSWAEGEAVLPLAWRSVGRDHLFPGFSGQLLARERDGATVLTLEGEYSVPLGIMGRFGDGLAGRRLARRTLTEMLERIARRIDSAVDRRLPSVAPYSVALTEQDHSEIYVG